MESAEEDACLTTEQYLELLIIKEYYSLVRLLCPDFPFEILQKTAKIILMDDAMDCLMSFSDFLFAFQLQFYFETFLEKCSDIYHNLLELSKSQQDSNSTNGVLDDISSSLFMETIRKDIYKKCLNTKFCCPPLPALQEILNPVTRVSFYGFLMALTKSPAVNSSIGVLPDKSCLMDFNEKDGTAASIWGSSVTNYDLGEGSKRKTLLAVSLLENECIREVAISTGTWREVRTTQKAETNRQDEMQRERANCNEQNYAVAYVSMRAYELFHIVMPCDIPWSFACRVARGFLRAANYLLGIS
eukprot:gene18063-19872_t